MRILFFGGNEFSLESLKKLFYSKHEIVGVVCQVDKPNLRGNKVKPSAVKTFALEKGINLYQFKKIKEENLDILKLMNPDLMVVVSYGQILSKEIINLAPFGIINVHASLLPKYRGASPIISAILNGEKETGITIMRVAEEVDSGDIILQENVEINEKDTAGTLSKKLSIVGANLLLKSIDLIEAGITKEKKQNHLLATFTKIIKKDDALIDFSTSANDVVNKVRAFNPKPIAVANIFDEKYKIYEVEKVLSDENITAGKIIACSPKTGLIIKCGENAIKILKIQAPGGKVRDIKDFLNGRKF